MIHHSPFGRAARSSSILPSPSSSEISKEVFSPVNRLPQGENASYVYVRALALGCFHSHISTRTFRRALTASLDSCAEIKSAISNLTARTKVTCPLSAQNRRTSVCTTTKCVIVFSSKLEQTESVAHRGQAEIQPSPTATLACTDQIKSNQSLLFIHSIKMKHFP